MPLTKDDTAEAIRKIENKEPITLTEYILYMVDKEANKYGCGIKTKEIKLGEPIKWN